MRKRIERLIITFDGTTTRFRRIDYAHFGYGLLCLSLLAIPLMAFGEAAAGVGLMSWMSLASLGLALGFFGEIDRGNKLAGRGVLTPAARVTIDPTKQQQQQQGYRSPSTDRPGRIEADGKSWPLDEAVGIDTCVSFEPAGSLNGRPRHRTQSLVLLVLQDEALLLWWGNDYDTAEEVVAALRSAIDDELPLVAPRPQEPSQGFPPHLSMRTTSGLLVAAIMTLSIGAAVAGGNLAADALPFWVTAAIVGLFGFVPLLLIRATLWRVEAGHRLAVLQEAADQRYAELRAGRSH